MSDASLEIGATGDTPHLVFYRIKPLTPYGASVLAYPLLLAIDPSNAPISAAGGSEAANISITLDNSDGGLTSTFGDVLFRPATVYRVVGSARTSIISGHIAGYSIGAEIRIQVTT